jgi:hypothetical protein
MTSTIRTAKAEGEKRSAPRSQTLTFLTIE